MLTRPLLAATLPRTTKHYGATSHPPPPLLPPPPRPPVPAQHGPLHHRQEGRVRDRLRRRGREVRGGQTPAAALFLEWGGVGQGNEFLIDYDDEAVRLAGLCMCAPLPRCLGAQALVHYLRTCVNQSLPPLLQWTQVSGVPWARPHDRVPHAAVRCEYFKRILRPRNADIPHTPPHKHTNIHHAGAPWCWTRASCAGPRRRRSRPPRCAARCVCILCV